MVNGRCDFYIVHSWVFGGGAISVGYYWSDRFEIDVRKSGKDGKLKDYSFV